MLTVVCGGQFGSEAKGACAGRLAADSKHERVIGVRVAGPNAGHTAYDGQGRRWALRQVPVIAVTRPDAELVIAAGSEIDPQVLLDEVCALDEAGLNVSRRLTVDQAATVITDANKYGESAAQLTDKVGSTGKGVGHARAMRAMRSAPIVADWHDAFTDLAESGVHFAGGNTAQHLNDALNHAHVILEGTQGYGLGLHTQYYPQVTSSDCRAIDFLSMAGINPWLAHHFEVWVVLRPYPIRVAGNSGPLKDETSWGALGLFEEYTTVTQKVRRVGAWDANLARAAVDANGGPGKVKVWLSMADQAVPAVAGWSGQLVGMSPHKPGYTDLVALLDRVERDTGVYPSIVGTGPFTALRVN